MSSPMRFTTLRLGVAQIGAGGDAVEFDVRILRDADRGYRVLMGELSEPFDDIEKAVARAESRGELSPDVAFEVRWRESIGPVGMQEKACPICGAAASTSSRYPRRLCPACVLEATDATGRALRFRNASASGGFDASYADSGETYDGDRCYVRGVPCRAEEHRMGGIVVQPV